MITSNSSISLIESEICQCSANLGSIHIRHVDTVDTWGFVYTEGGGWLLCKVTKFPRRVCAVWKKNVRGIVESWIPATKVITWRRTVSRLARTRTKVDKQANFMTRLELLISDKGRTPPRVFPSSLKLFSSYVHLTLSTREVDPFWM